MLPLQPAAAYHPSPCCRGSLRWQHDAASVGLLTGSPSKRAQVPQSAAVCNAAMPAGHLQSFKTQRDSRCSNEMSITYGVSTCMPHATHVIPHACAKRTFLPQVHQRWHSKASSRPSLQTPNQGLCVRQPVPCERSMFNHYWECSRLAARIQIKHGLGCKIAFTKK
jgi:hypothetical protein